jgi:Spy/CpxP family protein refolding chaperone
MISLEKNRHWLQAAVVSVGLLAACSLYASEPEVAPAAQSALVEMKGEGAGGMRMCKDHQQKLADELKLDDKQQTLFRTAMKQMNATMHDGMQLHEKLKDQVESDDYDEKKVRALVHKHNAEMEDRMVASSKAMHDFYQSLGPWQKGKFKAIKDDMHDKMRDHMKGARREHKHGHEHGNRHEQHEQHEQHHENPEASDQAK